MLAVQHPVRPPTPSYVAHRHQRGRSIEVSPLASTSLSCEKVPRTQHQRTTVASCHITTLDITSEKPPPTTPPPSSPELSSTPPSLCSSPSAYHSSSASCDYFDSPPSPPQSLEDQVHVAYALDDIHLAKVLLLKLKGIDVTGDDDPRIAAVKDEDFDVCFVPNGRLVDGLEDSRRKGMEQERIQRKREEEEEERKRQERLRECERKWEEERRRLREERELARNQREVRLREEDEQNRKEYEESLRHQQRKRATSKLTPTRTPSSSTRSLVSYKLSSSDSRSIQSVGNDADDEPFMYDFMITTSTPPPSASCSNPSRIPALSGSVPSSTTSMHRNPSASSFSRAPRSHSHSQYLDYPYPHHPETNSRTVTFSEVLTSMQGPLFPGDKKLKTNTLSTSSGSGRSTLVGSAYSHCSAMPSTGDEKRKRQNDLLESLLKVVEYEEDERRRRKGKAKAGGGSIPRPKVARKDSGRSIKLAACAVCSSAPSLTPSSTSASTSTLSSSSSKLSWLSFSSAASVSSLATTPSSASSLILESPVSTRFGKRASSWFASSASPAKVDAPVSPKSCTHTHLVPVPASDSPLPIPVTKTKTHRRSGSRLPSVSASSNPLSSPFSAFTSISRVESVYTPTPLTEYAKAEPRPSRRMVTVMRTQVLKFFEMAKGFQDAYVNATVLSVTTGFDSEDIFVERRERRKSDNGKRGEMNVKPAGERVVPQDLKKFLGAHIRRSSSSQLAASRYRQHRYHTSQVQGPSDSFVLQPYSKVVPPLPPALRTPLSEATPYKTHFKPVYQPCRSPFRLRSSSRSSSPALYSHPYHPYHPYHEEEIDLPPPPKSMFSPVVIPAEDAPRGRSSSSSSSRGAEKIVRVRAVENPVCLRVKAACRRYLDYRAGDHYRGGKGRIPIEEPLPAMKDGSLGGGGERLLQVVFEGVGRSRLGEDEADEHGIVQGLGMGKRCFDIAVFEDSETEDEMTDEEMEEMVEFVSTKSNSPYHSVRVHLTLSEKAQQTQRGRQRERGGRQWGR